MSKATSVSLSIIEAGLEAAILAGDLTYSWEWADTSDTAQPVGIQAAVQLALVTAGWSSVPSGPYGVIITLPV